MQQPAGRPSADARRRAVTPVRVDPLAALADASSQLRGLQRRLSLADSPAWPLTTRGALPARLDDRLSASGTRARKSASDPPAADRMASETYPLSAPPRVDFVVGANSRHRGRDPTVVYA